jgi:hypothetical protein
MNKYIGLIRNIINKGENKATDCEINILINNHLNFNKWEFELSTVLKIWFVAFWVMDSCSLIIGYQRGRNYRLTIHDIFSLLRMDAKYSSETLVTTTRLRCAMVQKTRVLITELI